MGSTKCHQHSTSSVQQCTNKLKRFTENWSWYAGDILWGFMWYRNFITVISSHNASLKGELWSNLPIPSVLLGHRRTILWTILLLPAICVEHSNWDGSWQYSWDPPSWQLLFRVSDGGSERGGNHYGMYGTLLLQCPVHAGRWSVCKPLWDHSSLISIFPADGHIHISFNISFLN